MPLILRILLGPPDAGELPAAKQEQDYFTRAEQLHAPGIQAAQLTPQVIGGVRSS